MSDYWYTVDTYGIDGFDVNLSYTYEHVAIRDMFDNEYDDIEEMERKVNNYDAYWIIGRAQVFLDGAEIGEFIVGGIYVESLDEFIEHYKDDLVSEAMYNAKEWIKRNLEKLNSIGA
jgi:hypothetical protein